MEQLGKRTERNDPERLWRPPDAPSPEQASPAYYPFLTRRILIYVVVIVASVAGYVWWRDWQGLAEIQRAFQSGAYDETIRLVEARLASHPEDQDAMLIAARAHAQLEQWGTSETYFAQVPLDESSDFHLRARGLLRRGLVIEATSVLEDILQRWPTDAQALQHMAAIRGEQLRPEEALAFARRLSQIDSHRVIAHVMIGRIEASLGNDESAIREFEQALRLSPTLSELPAREPADALLVYCESLLQTGRAEDAEPYALQACELGAGAHGHWILGKIFETRGDEEAAIESWRKAAELNERFVPAFLDLGLVLMHRRDPEGAIRWLRRAQEIDPENPSVKYALETARRRLDQSGAKPHQ